MTRVARYLATIAILAACAVTIPSTALAGNGKKPKHSSSCISAVCVYREPIPTDTGGYGNGGGGGTGSGGGGNTVVPLTKQASKALAHHGGKDALTLRRLATYSAYGAPQLLSAPKSTVVGPGVLGAAFDLGSGPTLLVALLVASTAFLAFLAGFRVARKRR